MVDNDPRHNTVGILSPGEMGCSLGSLLVEAGFRVITTTEGRSSRTRQLCREAGLTLVASVDKLLRHSDIVISLVPPGAALSLATEVANHTRGSTREFTYIDANSISPMTVTRISNVFRDLPVAFLDASIFGLAAQLRQRGSVYVSGANARQFAETVRPVLRVKVVGDLPGQASSLKMIISGIPKGLSALLIETLLSAHAMGLLDGSLEACDEIYPGIMEIVKRMLPTYPQHAERRCEELGQVEQTMMMSGVTPRIIHAVREVTSAVARTDWSNNGRQQWSLTEVILRLSAEGMLNAPHGRLDEVSDAPTTMPDPIASE
jgi:3-hydroxyisobutyrate dehydrogenase-like beta-hydroxyacid dehydrogenase